MIGTADQDAFIGSQRWAVVTTLRADGSPSNSVVFFGRDGDTLIFSTTTDRMKARTLTHDPRVAMTILDEGAPFRFATVEGRAAIEDDDLAEKHVVINRAMRNDPAWQPPGGFLERLQQEQRVVVRVHPERVSGVVGRS
ncbi:MAG: PPOX class F420-dependent oxidoreductase [Dehalococcoidia bacterium]|nr:PPOX class F420-dependent oxidoreductase [Dehalococcoidia bacterium]